MLRDIDSMVLERGDTHGFQNELFTTIINYLIKLTKVKVDLTS